MSSFKDMPKLKRIAIATVSALTFGALSALPSNAAHNADTLSLDTNSTTITAGETATAVASLSFLAANSGDTLTLTSSVVSLPSGAAQLAVLSVKETTSATVTLSADKYSADISSSVNSLTAVSAKLNLSLVAPSVAGTYVIRLSPTVKAGGGTLNSSAVLWSVIVNAADVKASAAKSTSIINSGETITATADATVFAPKTVSSDAAAVIVVTQKNAAGTSVSESLTATISGSGLIGTGSNHATISALGRSISVAAGNYIGIFADGTSGVGTVTITTQSGVVLGTESVTFYGDIAKVVTTVKKPVIATGSNADAISAVAYDANGVKVGAGTLTAISSDLTVISNSGTSASIVNGEALFSLTGLSTGAAGIVVKSGLISADTATVRVEGSAGSVKLAFDKATYAPGEAASITVTVLDTVGLVMSGKTQSNLFADGGITSSYGFSSGSETLTATSVTTDVNGIKTYKVFMPMTEGAVKITAKGGTLLPVASQVEVSASATVVSSATNALTQIAALSATVSSLKVLIDKLLALIIKIQKKVRA
jgi:hypothetical protein